MGVSVICKNEKISAEDFSFIESVFASSGSTLLIDEKDMNAIIGVTSSSPAYVFKFINAIFLGAKAQGLDSKELLNTICDMVIGSATLLKQSTDTPEELISKVASKGGTTEQALIKLDDGSNIFYIDVCISCHLIWFDFGELNMIPVVQLPANFISQLPYQMNTALTNSGILQQEISDDAPPTFLDHLGIDRTWCIMALRLLIKLFFKI
jgi:hypothetical protein